MPRSSAPVVIALDAGTTGVRAVVVDTSARVVDVAYRELTQHFPRPGWVEHDASDIWASLRDCLDEVAGRLAAAGRRCAAVGITNQRETVVAFNRRTGDPLCRAIVWQDRRTADACQALAEAGHLPLVRERTGLLLDPYFSATKMQWLLTGGSEAVAAAGRTGDLALGTVDSWVVWNLTGGPAGGAYVTDPTNASRTMLFDIVVRRWSDELCDLFGVPEGALAEVVPSSGRIGAVSPDVLGPDSPLAGVPVAGIAGDQHAALFGQACFEPGMAKATYGTGTFVLLNVGPTCPAPADGLLTTIAWDLGQTAAAVGDRTDDLGGPAGHHPSVSYALEGSVFTSGAAIQWLRDGLGLIGAADELEPLARSVGSTEGVVVVPAFAGLGSPRFDPYARGTIVGLSRGTGRAHLARAVVEALAFETRDVLDAMAAAGTVPKRVRVDGGASVMDLLLELQAAQSGVPVARPRSVESTALGAATLAGLSEGVWGSLEDLAAFWHAERVFEPPPDRGPADVAHQAWLAAVDRARGWARS